MLTRPKYDGFILTIDAMKNKMLLELFDVYGALLELSSEEPIR